MQHPRFRPHVPFPSAQRQRHSPRQPSRARHPFVGFVALLALLVLATACSGDDGTAAPAASTTTTSMSLATTTTTTLPPLEVSVSRTTIATAVVPLVQVYRDQPAGVALDPRASDAGAALDALLPGRSTLRPDAVPIPTIEGPVQGRRANDLGWEFDHPTPWSFELTFVVTEDHGPWLRVLFPVRPNGTQGWVSRDQVRLSTIDAHVRIDLTGRRLVATIGDEVIADTAVVIGAPATPTPTGRLYLTDFDERPAGSSYGPWIAALSGYSQALDEFSGGVPVIAIHGTNNPGAVGEARSNGCIRVPNDVIRVLRQRLPLGTPVDIWP
ncbi:MAG: L,D-transpeptidase [Actinobacteria bacterium]|nr:L,D-transpeptidase [Actinomycetota bacterium]